ncbi:MAG: inositol-1-monophosphatase [Gammaproteobacteria bacterium]|nr:inositol-1-monophosphatase [Gammaproteobacteria bacterium]
MHPMLNIAITAARSSGNIIRRAFSRLDELNVTQKANNDYVSEVDRMAEDEILRTIRKAYPDHGVLAEESGDSGSNGHSHFRWIIDPLDGTTNFLHGFPHFAVSIGLQRDNQPEVAVVYNPISEELFTASRGDGAQLNNRRIRVSSRRSLQGGLLGTGFPFRDHQHLDAYLATFKALLVETAGIRRPGSAALDLAYVAAGRIDGFWEIGLSPWDIAAGVLLVREAGGIVGDFTGGDNYLNSGNILAASPKVFAAMLSTITPHLTEELRR